VTVRHGRGLCHFFLDILDRVMMSYLAERMDFIAVFKSLGLCSYATVAHRVHLNVVHVGPLFLLTVLVASHDTTH